MKKIRLILLVTVSTLYGLSCASFTADEPDLDTGSPGTETSQPVTQPSIVENSDNNSLVIEPVAETSPPEVSFQGDIEFLNNEGYRQYDARKFRQLLQAEERSDGIVLNFEGADIKEVIALVIGKIMKQNYLIDPAVKGTVTLKTERPLNKDTVFYMLESILELYGARISRRTGHYRIYPQSKASLSTLGFGEIDNRVKLGYGYRIVPLQYAPAEEIMKILESVTNDDTVIKADTRRNLIILGGTSDNVNNMINAIDMFDVDWMKNTNVALIRVNHSNVTDVLNDLEKMLAAQGTDEQGMNLLTLEAIERLNSILVISRQYEHVQQVKSWIRTLDIPVESSTANLYVYNVKNSTAEKLATLLSDLFGAQVSSSDAGTEENITGPGSVPVLLTGDETGEVTRSEPESTPKKDSKASTKEPEIRIIAAEDTNSLLISATTMQYAKIEQALARLDTPPMQVLIEVTIMDVQLTDGFSYGMQWFLEHGDDISADDNATGGSAVLGDALSFAQTFSYSSVRASGDVRALIGLLASEGKVDVLSSPSILVRNNQKASIRVGDQQPISTSSLNDEGTVIATSVTFIDTGILLEIQPSISSSGAINVELTQEVIDVGDIDAATGQRTFLNRNLNTDVSVQNGQTIILGGLIRTNKARSASGVPGLRDLPVIGFLFGKTVTSEVRTELVIMLSPKIIRSPQEMNNVFDEYREKFEQIKF